MTVEIYSPGEFELTMTPTAIQHFQEQLKNRLEGAARLSIRKSGCSGFMYEIDFVDAEEPNDKTYTFSDVTLYVAQDALPILKGTEIDYVTEGVNSNIQFNNPNAKAMCGCGESFTL